MHTACRLIPLDKNPGICPIGSGEVFTCKGHTATIAKGITAIAKVIANIAVIANIKQQHTQTRAHVHTPS